MQSNKAKVGPDCEQPPMIEKRTPKLALMQNSRRNAFVIYELEKSRNVKRTTLQSETPQPIAFASEEEQNICISSTSSSEIESEESEEEKEVLIPTRLNIAEARFGQFVKIYFEDETTRKLNPPNYNLIAQNKRENKRKEFGFKCNMD